jgi:hypothetical protein
VALAPTTDRFSVERFSIRSLPPSFEARILSASETLPLIEVTSWSTVCATLAMPSVEARFAARKPRVSSVALSPPRVTLFPLAPVRTT